MTGSSQSPVVPRFPVTINLETVSNCNAACTFCPHGMLDKNSRNERMSDDMFYRIIAEAARYPELKELCFGLMNEPTLDSRIYQFLEHATLSLSDEVTLVLVTNGATLTSKNLDKLFEAPPHVLKVSVTGSDRKSYEEQMVGLSFDRTHSYLTDLASRLRPDSFPMVVINTVCTDTVAKQGYAELKELWASRGFNNVNLINVENRAGVLSSQMKMLTSQKLQYRSLCNRPSAALNILADGRVVLCCADWKEEVIVGSLQTSSMFEIWNGPILNKYRTALASGQVGDLSPCNNCMQAEIVVDGIVMTNFREELLGARNA